MQQSADLYLPFRHDPRQRIADAKVKELESDAYGGRRQSFAEPGPALHDEPGAYVPQVPCPPDHMTSSCGISTLHTFWADSHVTVCRDVRALLYGFVHACSFLVWKCGSPSTQMSSSYPKNLSSYLRPF